MQLPRLLLIDDDVKVLRALARMLRQAFDTTVAPTLIDARRFIAEESFDVILCDMRMPSMNGESFVATLPACVAARVVFMSGDEEAPGVVSMYPRLLKPFTVAELVSALGSRRPAAA
ncbi:MAG: response regulator [Polyangiaceae bacterium]